MTNFDNGRGVFRKSYIITENQNKVSMQNYHRLVGSFCLPFSDAGRI